MILLNVWKIKASKENQTVDTRTLSGNEPETINSVFWQRIWPQQIFE